MKILYVLLVKRKNVGEIMPTYRRKRGSDTWHWCRNCSKYPTEDYEEITVYGRPTSGELCNECLAKERENNCR